MEYRILGEQKAEDGTLIRIVEPVKEEEPKKKGIIQTAVDKWNGLSSGGKLLAVLGIGGTIYSGYRILGDCGFIGGMMTDSGALLNSDVNIDVGNYLE